MMTTNGLATAVVQPAVGKTVGGWKNKGRRCQIAIRGLETGITMLSSNMLPLLCGPPSDKPLAAEMQDTIARNVMSL